MTDKEFRQMSRAQQQEPLLEVNKKNRSLRRIDIQKICAGWRKKERRKQKIVYEMPSTKQLEAELKRVKYQSRYHCVLRSTIYTLIVVAAIAILVATLWLPVLQIYGNSMNPTLQDGEIIFSVKTSEFESGDIIAFYYNNKILVKRVICGPGDWINIDEDGTVYVNEVRLDESYLVEKALGDCNIELPFQVPDGRYFVMGDHRSTSVDSRNTAVGCVAGEQIVGRIIFRVWPLNRLGRMK
ncbi:MAG: signal peptidase I [Eubacteriales bacterium]|nr:signal peptidase I [Eubacteriales bacterium]